MTLIKKPAIADGLCRFITETIDAVWKTRDNVSAGLCRYFVKDYIRVPTSRIKVLVAGVCLSWQLI